MRHLWRLALVLALIGGAAVARHQQPPNELDPPRPERTNDAAEALQRLERLETKLLEIEGELVAVRGMFRDREELLRTCATLRDERDQARREIKELLAAIGGRPRDDPKADEAPKGKVDYETLLREGSVVLDPDSPSAPTDAPEDFAAVGFRYVAPGSFAMGRSAEEIREVYRSIASGAPQFHVEFSKPRHPVRVTEGFMLATREVTRAQFLAFALGRGGMLPEPLRELWEGRVPASDPRWQEPMTEVGWREALDYCRWLGERCGWEASLPTEVEWEYAARGPQSQRHAWTGAERPGSGSGSARDVAWPAAEDVSWCGIRDLTGSVQEWCWDRWEDDRLEDQAASARDRDGAFVHDPHVARAGSDAGSGRRVCRGGRAGETAIEYEAATRRWKSASSRESYLGFRPVLLLPKAPAARERL